MLLELGDDLFESSPYRPCLVGENVGQWMSIQKKRQSETYRDDCENENHDWENWGCFLGVCRVVIFGGFMPLKLKVWVNSFTCFRRMCLQETATVITLVKRHLSHVHFILQHGDQCTGVTTG